MSFDNTKDFIFFELIYKLSNYSGIKLFDFNFVYKNKDNCKIIYNGKEYELTMYFHDIDEIYNHNYNGIIKIILKINNKITNLGFMFNNCRELLSIRGISKLDIIKINESFYSYNSNIYSENDSNKNEKSKNFYGDGSDLSNIPLMSINSISITINSIFNDESILSKRIFCNSTNMFGIFKGCSSLLTLPDISKWDTTNITTMDSMFNGCSSLTSFPDISKWDIKNVSSMNSMFSGCSSLTSLPDISKWDTKNVTTMDSLFNSCSSLASLPDLSKWNISTIHKSNYQKI